MRSVRARSAAAKKPRGRGRQAQPVRKVASRPVSRGKGAGRSESLRERLVTRFLGGLPGISLLRRPMLLLTLLLVLGGVGAGLFAVCCLRVHVLYSS